VVTETAFQSRLDEVLAGTMARHRPRTQVHHPLTLRSATLMNPSPLRQAARTALLASVPRRFLFAAGQPASGAVCLTFDDGPHESVTPLILDTLKSLNAPATFFVRGDRASLRPEVLRRMVADGHLLGHHSWSHGAPGQTSASELLDEVRRTREWLRQQLGADSTWFRPPHGKLSLAKAIGLWRSGVTVALWSVDPGDVFRKNASEMLDWFRANPPRSGDVVLLHDTSTVTLEALPALIGLIRDSGLELRTLDAFGGRPARS
jgi:peptidoglycan-N-acetylglucosamine deacetylase